MGTRTFKVIEEKCGKVCELAAWSHATDKTAWAAVNFAAGYVQALVDNNIEKFDCPAVPQVDGWHWYNHEAEHFIKCVDENGNILVNLT